MVESTRVTVQTRKSVAEKEVLSNSSKSGRRTGSNNGIYVVSLKHPPNSGSLIVTCIVRRLNHISDLESSASTLRSELAALQSTVDALQTRETHLQSWISQLEIALFRHGLNDEVESVRQSWAGLGQVDPLSTLAQAASSQLGSAAPLPNPGLPPDGIGNGNAANGRGEKRRRRDEDRSKPLSPTRLRTSRDRPSSGFFSQFADSHAPSGPLSPYSCASPRSIRISDLLSPVPEAKPQPLGFSMGSIWPAPEDGQASEDGRWSLGESSVTHVDSMLVDQAKLPGKAIRTHYSWDRSLIPYIAYQAQVFNFAFPFPYPIPNPFSTVDFPPTPGNLDMTTHKTHPSIRMARSLLLSILPNPLTFPLPPLLSNLSPSQQQIILDAISHLSSPSISHHFGAQQLRLLPAADAKIILEYQSSANADPRLVLLPIAILRAHIIAIQSKHPEFDLHSFISDTLSSARIFGVPLDPDAWEMSDAFWDAWEGWVPGGREYCRSLAEWRRRDGHIGSTVVEIILGLERPAARRGDAVGRPRGWSHVS